MRKLKKVLLIDDDDINNYINVHIIRKLQIAEKIKVVKNGKEAFDFIIQRCAPNEMICPEFIILDDKMPVMDGIEFLEAINGINFINRTEVIILALAANLRPQEIEQYKKLGVHEFSPKPLSDKLVMQLYNKYWALK